MSGRAEPADTETCKPLGFAVDTWHTYPKMTNLSTSGKMDGFIILASIFIFIKFKFFKKNSEMIKYIWKVSTREHRYSSDKDQHAL